MTALPAKMLVCGNGLRVVPFTLARCRVVKGAVAHPIHPTLPKVRCLQSADKSSAEERSSLPSLAPTSSAWAVLASSLLCGRPTLAADEATLAAEADQVAAAATTGGSASDLIISAFFTVVVGLLAIVTLGVGYLSFKQWLDSRQEQEDRKQEAARIQGVPSREGEPVAAGKAKLKKEKKGFGSTDNPFKKD